VKPAACDVVIATRNRPDALARCLGALARQTHQHFSVIVVDDCSDESLEPVVADPELRSLDIELIRLPQQSGPAAARNAGADAATAEFVAFIDDDVVADRALLEVHLANVTGPQDDGRPVVSFGPFVQPADWEPTPWNLWEARQAKKEADAMLRGEYRPSWRQFHTGNNCLPVAAFREVGGFDPRFKRAEDDELALRLRDHGCAFQFEPRAIAWHYSNRSLEAWLAIPRAYARFDVEIDRLHPHVGHLRDRKRGLQRRRAPVRAVRRIARGPISDLAISASVGAGRLLYRVGLTDLAMGALSVAYDLSYVESLRVAESEVGSSTLAAT
jgi:GT2 family glycosyltransferase